MTSLKVEIYYRFLRCGVLIPVNEIYLKKNVYNECSNHENFDFRTNSLSLVSNYIKLNSII